MYILKNNFFDDNNSNVKHMESSNKGKPFKEQNYCFLNNWKNNLFLLYEFYKYIKLLFINI